MEPKNLIGKQIYGFKFLNNYFNGLPYNNLMDDYINKIGTIVRYNKYSEQYVVKFEDGAHWWYPEEPLQEYLVNDEKENFNTEYINELFKKIEQIV